MRDAPFFTSDPDWPAGELALWRVFARADFDPVTMTALALGGGALSAAGTLAGGNAAAAMGAAQQRAEQFAATQDRMNAAADIASQQRKALDTQLRANLTTSTAVASEAAGGVETTTGSPLTNQAQIESRGHYAAGLDLWNGENAATGDMNKAISADYTGEIDLEGGKLAQEGSYFTAAGTLASSGASAYKMYNSFSSTPSAGARLGFG